MCSKQMSKSCCKAKSSINVTLGGGGARGASLSGFLDFAIEHKIAIDKILGVSAGSLVAVFYTNGYSPLFITERFADELQQMPLNIFMKAIIPPFSFKRLCLGGAFDMVPFMRHLVEKYDLKPQPNLRILAYDVNSHKPVIFEGSDYDLALALAASCAIPFIMRPVEYTTPSGEKHYLVDGGTYHLNPSEFSDSPSIVVRLFSSTLINSLYPNSKHDFVAHIGDKFVSPLAPVSEKWCNRMREIGYQASKRDLLEYVTLGLIPACA